MSIDLDSKYNKHFYFKNEIIKINNNSTADEDKDKALALLFRNHINPGQIPDGHCGSCAFNSHLHLVGQEIEEAIDPGE
jgi:hypothetical protein